MSDPIGTTASALSIAGRIIAAGRWVWRKLPRKPDQSPLESPQDFEVLPVTFNIYLTHAVPYVELSLYAINHRRRALMLHELKITALRISGGPNLEQIPLIQEFKIPPKNSFRVYCRRSLLDSEVRAVMANTSSGSASFSLIARAKDGLREYTYGPVSARWVEGWIDCPKV